MTRGARARGLAGTDRRRTSRYASDMSRPSPEPAALAEARLARRDAVLAAVARAAERLSEPHPWESLVPDALRLLGEATGVSRVYVFDVERRDGVDLVNQRLEWYAPGVTAQIDNPELQGVPLEGAGFGRWAELLRAGEAVFGDIEEFPESERPLLEMQEIKSLLVQPIFEGKRWWGFMGFDACAAVQSWSRVEVDTLRIAALVLGSAIHRQMRDAQLRETQKLEALGSMAGSVAHDFNNVLMVIAGAMELLKGELEHADQRGIARGQHCAMIDQALDRAGTLTRRLLEFSKRRAGAPQVLSPLDLLRREEPLLRQAIGARVSLRIIHGGDGRAVAPVRIDPTEFAQVALNLAVNARDAMPRGGELVFDVSTLGAGDTPAATDRIPDGDWTLVRAIDCGEGMAPEVLAHAFEPFFTTKPPDRGTGLGLSTVHAIVTAAGGHIKVSSTPGRGTEFRIYLPPAHR